ncbi:hypothetical protein ACFVAJ_17635 [Agromyces sp. NPDC057679]|uniref:hypothetical protein n=1 Tax=Agromyces sp. NPDC057679 TaxID=3346207 RepID=UPI0036727734
MTDVTTVKPSYQLAGEIIFAKTYRSPSEPVRVHSATARWADPTFDVVSYTFDGVEVRFEANALDDLEVADPVTKERFFQQANRKIREDRQADSPPPVGFGVAVGCIWNFGPLTMLATGNFGLALIVAAVTATAGWWIAEKLYDRLAADRRDQQQFWALRAREDANAILI